jgi:hypothetical protein
MNGIVCFAFALSPSASLSQDSRFTAEEGSAPHSTTGHSSSPRHSSSVMNRCVIKASEVSSRISSARLFFHSPPRALSSSKSSFVSMSTVGLIRLNWIVERTSESHPARLSSMISALIVQKLLGFHSLKAILDHLT